MPEVRAPLAVRVPRWLSAQSDTALSSPTRKYNLDKQTLFRGHSLPSAFSFLGGGFGSLTRKRPPASKSIDSCLQAPSNLNWIISAPLPRHSVAGILNKLCQDIMGQLNEFKIGITLQKSPKIFIWRRIKNVKDAKHVKTHKARAANMKNEYEIEESPLSSHTEKSHPIQTRSKPK